MIFTDINKYKEYLESEAEKAKSRGITADEMLTIDPCGENPEMKPRAIAVLGNFDGVHKGHAALIKHAKKIKQIFPEDKIVVWTFGNLSKGGGFITPPEKKAALLEELGADIVILDDFNRISSLSPMMFVEGVLHTELNAGSVICGYNYHFGNGQAGDAPMLKQLCLACGISCSVIYEVKVEANERGDGGESDESDKGDNGDKGNKGSKGDKSRENGKAKTEKYQPTIAQAQPTAGIPDQYRSIMQEKYTSQYTSHTSQYAPLYTSQNTSPYTSGMSSPYTREAELSEPDGRITVSSSKIKELLAFGDVKTARLLLGRPFSVSAEVVRGRHAGTDTLMIPTVNQKIPLGLTEIKTGVYASFIKVDGKELPSVTDIGDHPTFGEGDEKLIETHIIEDDFNAELYGKQVEVFLLERLRDEIKFESTEDLKNEIQKNIASATKIYSSYKKVGV